MAPTEWDAWPSQEPPAGFAQRVVAEALRRGARTSGRARAFRIGAALAVASAAAAALFLGRHLVPPEGDARATDARREVAMGGRAVLVLEQGAHVAWHGDQVAQDAGDVFYRVERGERFVVRTPAGDVIVTGTCFRVSVTGEVDPPEPPVAGAGAASAVAVVGVYEGKVTATRGDASVDLAAGEGARLDRGGIEKSPLMLASGDAPAREDPLLAANQSLALAMKGYKDRISAIEVEKSRLELGLASAREKLATAGTDVSGARSRGEFELSREDWAGLAKDGIVKYQIPCTRTWTPSPEWLNGLGLSPDDASALKAAYRRSNQRVWSLVKPACAQAIGGVDLAERLGLNTCVHMMVVLATEKDAVALDEAMRRIGEVRAGQRPMPRPSEMANSVEGVLLAMTGEMIDFEADLAQSLGPDAAHRVAFADGMCMAQSTWGNHGLRSPD
jgi:hypothetical protein